MSALTLSETSEFIYIGFWDAPQYSFAVLDTQSLRVLAKHSSTSFVERHTYDQYMKNLILNREGGD